MVRTALTVLCAGCAAAAGQAGRPVLRPRTSGVTAVLQAVSAPGENVAWVTGHEGVVLRTTDGGATWVRRTVPDGDSLQFRDVHALDSATAWLLAAGPGDRSRIYRTTDGGRTWELQFRNRDPAAFYDCFTFFDARRAIAFSDAVNGRFILLATADGERWSPAPADALPPAQPGEGAFAASGTCVTNAGERHAWIGTGASGTARVLRTADGARTWTVATVPIAGGPAAGIATVAFRDTASGVALGGNIADPRDSAAVNVARTQDGGRTWRAAGRTALRGAVYGAAFVPGTPALIAVGPGGLDWSADGGATWVTLDSAAYWSAGFATGRVGWAVGAGGRIVRIEVPSNSPDGDAEVPGRRRDARTPSGREVRGARVASPDSSRLAPARRLDCRASTRIPGVSPPPARGRVA